ncbi:hypothetical protein DESA109040_17075 [Deinococcus saxicola]
MFLHTTQAIFFASPSRWVKRLFEAVCLGGASQLMWLQYDDYSVWQGIFKDGKVKVAE